MRIKLDEGAFEPTRGYATDAGMDLLTPVDVTIPKGGSATIDTGVHVQLPRNTFGKLESKSGLNVKHSVVCLGGVIDESYRGSIAVKLYNFGDEDYTFKRGPPVVLTQIKKPRIQSRPAYWMEK